MEAQPDLRRFKLHFFLLEVRELVTAAKKPFPSKLLFLLLRRKHEKQKMPCLSVYVASYARGLSSNTSW